MIPFKLYFVLAFNSNTRYYYLFYAFDWCCEGSRSNYKIKVSRSTSATGPFYDKDGVLANHGGGSLVLSEIGLIKGPGGTAIFADDNGTDYIVYHYYDAGNVWGIPRLAVNQLQWDSNLWPVVV
jgi:arabinan endo-1,5-alpha-L-arabinosidase